MGKFMLKAITTIHKRAFISMVRPIYVKMEISKTRYSKRLIKRSSRKAYKK